MSAQPQPSIPPEEDYLASEREASYKSEYFYGEVVAMAGASNEYIVVANLITALNLQLRNRDCSVRASGMRLLVVNSGLYTYPDIAVVCGPPQFRPDAELDTLLNPTLLIEVLPESTAKHDREIYRRPELPDPAG